MFPNGEAAQGRPPRTLARAVVFVIDRGMAGHTANVSSRLLPVAARESQPLGREADAVSRVAEVYDAHFEFVWRTVRRLGVEERHVEDMVQEVFIVVHRRLAEFEGRASLKTWLFGITRRVVQGYRRGRARKPVDALGDKEIADPRARNAETQLDVVEATRLLHSLLEQLDDEKREVFVLSELEELSGPAVAEALELNLKTAYARIHAARRAFERALQRHRARQEEGA
jgi:RNA polymerase sigma-70 factor (ECF subfamily)